MSEEPSIFTGKLSDKDLERFFWEVYDASRERFGGRSGESPTFKKRWARNFAGYGSDFLSKAERDYLISTERPPVEINLLTSKVNAVRGSVAASRMEAQFKPHTTSDIANVKAGWMTLLNRKAMIDCGGYEQQDQVFHNGLITGYGCSEIYLDTSRVPFRGILKKNNLQEHWPDPDACDMNLADRTTDLRVRKWLVEQVIGRWPEKEDEIKKHAQQYGTFGVGQRGNRSTGKQGGGAGGGKESLRGKVEVAELIYQRWMKRVRWYDPERRTRRDTLPDELEARKKELAGILDVNGAPLYEAVEEDEYRGETWFRAHCLLGGFDTTKKNKGARGLLILDHEESPRVGSTFNWLTGLAKEEPDKGQVEFFSIFDIGYGLQMVLNRVRQERLAIMARDAKGGIFALKSAVPSDMDPDRWAKEYSVPGSVTWLSDEEGGGMGSIQEKAMPRNADGMMSMEKDLIQEIGQAMAITDAFVGSVQQERSAVYLSNLQQQGLVTLGPVLGPYIAYIKACGITMVEMLIRHLPVADIDRLLDNPTYEGLTHQANPETGELEPIMVNDPDAPVMDEAGEQAFDPMTQEPLYEQVPLTAGRILKEENPLDYEVNVDAGEATISLRYAIWENLEQGILQTFQNALPEKAFRVFLLFMVRMMPVPGEQGSVLAKDIQKAIEEEDLLQTLEGVKAFLLAQGPDVALPAMQEVAQQLEEGLPPGDGGTPEAPPVSEMGEMEEMGEAPVQ